MVQEIQWEGCSTIAWSVLQSRHPGCFTKCAVQVEQGQQCGIAYGSGSRSTQHGVSGKMFARGTRTYTQNGLKVRTEPAGTSWYSQPNNKAVPEPRSNRTERQRSLMNRRRIPNGDGGPLSGSPQCLVDPPDLPTISGGPSPRAPGSRFQMSCRDA